MNKGITSSVSSHLRFFQLQLIQHPTFKFRASLRNLAMEDFELSGPDRYDASSSSSQFRFCLESFYLLGLSKTSRNPIVSFETFQCKSAGSKSGKAETETHWIYYKVLFTLDLGILWNLVILWYSGVTFSASFLLLLL